MTLSGDFDGSLSGGEVKRLSELSAERAPAVNLAERVSHGGSTM
jgi:hypothetical protein